jgi:hypothetical protein
MARPASPFVIVITVHKCYNDCNGLTEYKGAILIVEPLKPNDQYIDIKIFAFGYVLPG